MSEFLDLTWTESGQILLLVGVAAVAVAFPQAKYAFHRWRLDRRFARDRYMLREELNEYHARMGEEPNAPDYARIAKMVLVNSAGIVGTAWFARKHLEWAWEGAMVAGLVVYGLFQLWKRINDPEAETFPVGQYDVPPEAVLGFVAAIGVVGLILGLAWFFA